MKKSRWIYIGFTFICLLSMIAPFPVKGAISKKRILATTFPIYQITRNVTKGYADVSVDIMLPTQMGCPHDYVATPQDIEKLVKADVLVVNGLGMESFLEASIKKANPDLATVDSSHGMDALISYAKEGPSDLPPYEWTGVFQLNPGNYQWTFTKIDGSYADPSMNMAIFSSNSKDPITDLKDKAFSLFSQKGTLSSHGNYLKTAKLHTLVFDPSHSETRFQITISKSGTYVFFTQHLPSEFSEDGLFFSTDQGKAVMPVRQHPESDDHHHHHHHDHGGVNPHLFVSPQMVAKLAMNIAAGLSKADPNGATIFYKNANDYSKRMGRLHQELVKLSGELKKRRIVQTHGIFDYLARDMGLEIAGVIQVHGEQPSASEMMTLVKTIREKRVGAIFTEPQYPKNVGETLSRETGVPVVMVDPFATGPKDAPLNAFETMMKKNMKTIESALGE